MNDIKSIFLILILILIFSTFHAIEAKEWNHSAGTYKSERFFNGDQITPSNVNDLVVAWKYSSGKILYE